MQKNQLIQGITYRSIQKVDFYQYMVRKCVRDVVFEKKQARFCANTQSASRSSREPCEVGGNKKKGKYIHDRHEDKKGIS